MSRDSRAIAGNTSHIKIFLILCIQLVLCMECQFMKGPRTVLMKDCPLKWSEKSFKENDSFSIQNIVGSTLELSAKKFFSLDKFLLKNMD